MFESLLRVRNLCWAGDAQRTAIDPATTGAHQVPHGRFACATPAVDGTVTLARDRLGLNKLFVAVHESGKVVAANYLVDLVRHGVPFEAIYSVPSGHAVRMFPKQNHVEVSRYGEASDRGDLAGADLAEVARDIRAELENWFSRFAAQFPGRHRILDLAALGDVERAVMQGDGETIIVHPPQLLEQHLRLAAGVDEHQRGLPLHVQPLTSCSRYLKAFGSDE